METRHPHCHIWTLTKVWLGWVKVGGEEEEEEKLNWRREGRRGAGGGGGCELGREGGGGVGGGAWRRRKRSWSGGEEEELGGGGEGRGGVDLGERRRRKLTGEWSSPANTDYDHHVGRIWKIRHMNSWWISRVELNSLSYKLLNKHIYITAAQTFPSLRRFLSSFSPWELASVPLTLQNRTRSGGARWRDGGGASSWCEEERRRGRRKDEDALKTQAPKRLT